MLVSVRSSRSFVAAAIAMAASGCAAGTGGQNLGNTSLRPAKLLTAGEMQLACPGIKTSLQSHAAEVKRLQGEMAKELKQPAPTLDRMLKRSSEHDGVGTLAYDKIAIERRLIAALKERLQDKHCSTFDVERAIAEASMPANSCPVDITKKYANGRTSQQKSAECR